MKRFFLFLAVSFLSFGCAAGGGDDSGEESFSVSSSSSNLGTDVNLTQRVVQFCDTKDPDGPAFERLSSLFQTFQSSRLNQTSQTAISTIPVRFHVISQGEGFDNGEVPDSFLIEQIDILNRAFSGESGGVETSFRFFLGGINRVDNPAWFTLAPGSSAEIDMKRALKVGGAETLNVYVADIELPDVEGIILGYSTLPVFYNILEQFDGIVLNYRAVPGGPLENYNLGHTLIHEAGHWLGLLHTFTGECDGLFNDLVADTPREKQPSQLCPEPGFDTCPGQEGVDPISNHMTYTADACRSGFTNGQVDFMNFNAFVFRGFGSL